MSSANDAALLAAWDIEEEWHSREGYLPLPQEMADIIRKHFPPDPLHGFVVLNRRPGNVQDKSWKPYKFFHSNREAYNFATRRVEVDVEFGIKELLWKVEPAVAHIRVKEDPS